MEKFICKICNYSCSLNYSGTHLKNKHGITGKQYYDKYIKKENDGLCKVCQQPTKFFTIKNGYRECCSLKCANQLKNIQLFEKYNVTNLFELSEVKEKSKQTTLKKYGVENISQLNSVKKQKKKTLLKNYGVEFGLQSPEIKLKQQRTMLERYGVKAAMHCQELLDKAIQNGCGKVSAVKYTTKFEDEITIQGSYERKFVELCEKHNIRILNGPMLKYDYNGTKRYFVDFEIIQNNKKRLIEIKSSYYYDKYKEQIDAKNKAANNWSLQSGYLPFVMMVDNIYIPGN